MTLIASLAERSVLKFPLFIPHGEPVNVPVLKTNLKFVINAFNVKLNIVYKFAYLTVSKKSRSYFRAGGNVKET